MQGLQAARVLQRTDPLCSSSAATATKRAMYGRVGAAGAGPAGGGPVAARQGHRGALKHAFTRMSSHGCLHGCLYSHVFTRMSLHARLYTHVFTRAVCVADAKREMRAGTRRLCTRRRTMKRYGHEKQRTREATDTLLLVLRRYPTSVYPARKAVKDAGSRRETAPAAH